MGRIGTQSAGEEAKKGGVENHHCPLKAGTIGYKRLAIKAL